MPLIIGIILIVFGGYMALFQRKQHADHMLEIQVQETKTIPEVREALEAMAPIDPNYREMVEVKGVAQSEQDVITPYSREKVAFYIAKTVQVSETTETYTDSDGNSRTRTQKHYDTVSEEESTAPLLLKDQQGNEIVIETNGTSKKLDLQKSFDRFDNNRTAYDNRSYSRYNNYNVQPRGNSRIQGYKKTEEVFRLNAPLYALGEAYMQDGRIYLGPPRAKDMPFIVTSKSEEQLIKEKKSSQKIALFGGIAAIIVGIIVIAAYVLS